MRSPVHLIGSGACTVALAAGWLSADEFNAALRASLGPDAAFFTGAHQLTAYVETGLMTLLAAGTPVAATAQSAGQVDVEQFHQQPVTCAYARGRFDHTEGQA